MKLAVLSGKGGTGKTFVATNLACVGQDLLYVDADVEEPNGFLYLKPKETTKEPISVKVPYIHEDLCDGCRTCLDFCRFHALAYINYQIVVFDKLCHECGGCALFCPNEAISEKKRQVGNLYQGKMSWGKAISGQLDIGEESGMPILGKLFDQVEKTDYGNVIVDGPPGSGCLVIDTIRHVDYILLVAEASRFGLENMKILVNLLRKHQKPFALVLNKYEDRGNFLEDYCQEQDIRIMGRIEYDKNIAAELAKGNLISTGSTYYKTIFEEIFSQIKEAYHETITCS